MASAAARLNWESMSLACQVRRSRSTTSSAPSSAMMYPVGISTSVRTSTAIFANGAWISRSLARGGRLMPRALSRRFVS